MTNLCIFLPTGRTYTFREITVLTNNENALEFTYVAMSDGRVKIAHFLKGSIAGWSEWEEDIA